jgi:hypothetical protein
LIASPATFDQCWIRILRIVPGTTIGARGFVGGAHGEFQITATNNDSIRVRSDVLGSKRILKEEFEAIFQRLRTRNNGIPNLSATSPHSEYILGILHHIGAKPDR